MIPTRRSAAAAGLAVLCLLAGAVGNSSVAQGAGLEDANRLAGALWSERPACLEVIVVESITKPARTREQIEATVRAIYGDSDKAGSVVRNPAAFEDEVRQEVSRLLEKEGKPRTVRRRAVIRGASESVEERAIESKEDVGAPFTERLVNHADELGNLISSYRIDHREKIESLLKGQWNRADYAMMGTFSDVAKVSLMAALGRADQSDPKKPKLVPDPEKIAACASGKMENLKVTLAAEKDAGGTPVTIVELRVRDGKFPIMRWKLDAADMRMCYREEILEPETGNLQVVREASDFMPMEGDAGKFPRKATFITYSKDGATATKICERAVEKVAVRNDIPADFFEFKVANDYAIVDYRYGKPIIIQKGALDKELSAAAAELEPLPPYNPDKPKSVKQPPDKSDVKQAEAPPAPATDTSRPTKPWGIIVVVFCLALVAGGVVLLARTMRKR